MNGIYEISVRIEESFEIHGVSFARFGVFDTYEKRYGLAAESIKVKLNNGVSSVYLT
jgi:hypothetical protein